MGVRLMPGTHQAAAAPAAFDELFKQFKPSRIIELGTGSGVFTSWLANTANVPVFTFDRNISRQYKTVVMPKCVRKYSLDVFTHEAHVGALIRGPGAALVLCDGGNKPREVRTFAAYLKLGDVIMAHDYCVNRDVFADEFRHKIWNTCRIVAADVDTTLAAYKLVPFMSAAMSPVVWGCWRCEL